MQIENDGSELDKTTTWLTDHLAKDRHWIQIPGIEKTMYMFDGAKPQRNHWVIAHSSGVVETLQGVDLTSKSDESELAGLLAETALRPPASIAYYKTIRLTASPIPEHLESVSMRKILYALDRKKVERGVFWLELRAKLPHPLKRGLSPWSLEYIIPSISSFYPEQYQANVIQMHTQGDAMCWSASVNMDKNDEIKLKLGRYVENWAEIPAQKRNRLAQMMRLVFDMEGYEYDTVFEADKVGAHLLESGLESLSKPSGWIEEALQAYQ